MTTPSAFCLSSGLARTWNGRRALVPASTTGKGSPARTGQPIHPEQVTKSFQRLAIASGLRPVRFHDLRHGAASLRLAAGVELAAVSKGLGHRLLALMSDTYSHVLHRRR